MTSEAGGAELVLHIRRVVRRMLEDSPVYSEADPDRRRQLAGKLVDVSMMAARLLAEDQRLTGDVGRRARDGARARRPGRPVVATAQSAGESETRTTGNLS